MKGAYQISCLIAYFTSVVVIINVRPLLASYRFEKLQREIVQAVDSISSISDILAIPEGFDAFMVFCQAVRAWWVCLCVHVSEASLFLCVGIQQ